MKIAKEDAFKTEETWPNLVQDGFVVGEVPKERQRDRSGPNRHDNTPRDLVVKPTYYDDKEKGEYMRLKNSDDDEVEQKLKEF